MLKSAHSHKIPYTFGYLTKNGYHTMGKAGILMIPYAMEQNVKIKMMAVLEDNRVATAFNTAWADWLAMYSPQAWCSQRFMWKKLIADGTSCALDNAQKFPLQQHQQNENLNESIR